MSTNRILALETATKICSVAVSENGVVAGEFSIYVPHAHVERLVSMINDLLKNLRLKYSDLDAIAVSNGPGSFTGLRIGLSVAKGIAFAEDKQIIAVPTLDALALRARILVDRKTVVPVLHARGREFYYCRYKFVNSFPERSGDYKVSGPAEIAEEFDSETIFVGEGVAELVKEDCINVKFGERSFCELTASAVEVGMAAQEKFDRQEFSDLRTLVPMYVKDFVTVKGNPLKKIMERI